MRPFAVLLLLLATLRHLGYETAPEAAKPFVWNALGALIITALLLVVWSEQKSPVVGAVVAYWLYEEALVATCSIWRTVDWWPVAERENLCSAKFGVLPDTVSLLLIGACIALVSDEPSRRK